MAANDRPIAFVLGAALSTSGGRGVAGVRDVIRMAITEFPDVDPDRRTAADLEMSDTDMGRLYRETMSALGKAYGPTAQLQVQRQAVAQAWRGEHAPTEGDIRAEDVGGWELTPGLQALGDFVTRFSQVETLVTTNFDPLIEVAIQRAGGSWERTDLTADKTPSVAVSGGAQSGVHRHHVVHVHGFWTQSVMHTGMQLLVSRPRLSAALQALFRSNTVIVLGYGGWDDVITRALEAVAFDETAAAEVLWCFYESDEIVAQARNTRLFERVGRLLADGFFQPYFGIDCHTLLPALITDATAGDVASVSSADSAISLTQPGWLTIDSAFLRNTSSLLSDQDVRRYFDGAGPEWGIIHAGLIPRTATASSMIQGLAATPPGSASTFRALVAQAGDGKSTVLMQVAAAIAERDDWEVRFRSVGNLAVDWNAFLQSLTAGVRTLVVVDHVEEVVAGILAQAGRLGTLRDCHFLVSSRLIDWRNAQGDIDVLARHLDARLVDMRPMSEGDASAIVRAWERIVGGLGALESIPAGPARTERLLDAVEADRRGSGSLLGGLFRLRFDRAHLDAHVAELMRMLQRNEIEGTNTSLLQAFLYVAALEVTGVEGLDRRIWAHLLGVPLGGMRRLVEYRLGREAATSSGGGLVQVRHPELARSALRVLRRSDYGVDLIRIYEDLVESTILVGRDARISRYSEIVHMSTRLQENLIDCGYPRGHAGDVAEAAALQAVSVSPDVVPFSVDLGSILRRRGDAARSCEYYEDTFSRNVDGILRSPYARGFLWDWSVSAALVGDLPTAAWLRLFALSDFRREHLNPQQAVRSLVGLIDIATEAEINEDKRIVWLSAAWRAADLLSSGDSSKWQGSRVVHVLPRVHDLAVARLTDLLLSRTEDFASASRVRAEFERDLGSPTFSELRSSLERLQ